MKNRLKTALILLGISAAALPFSARAAAAADKPNVIVFFADDQRADTIAALGNPHIQTPNLDRLVRGGVSFKRAYMQGGMNAATCMPSRAMLLSGQSLFKIDQQLKQYETWPAAFARAGYATFITGKWHNGADSVPLSFQKGRSIFVGGMTDPLKARLCDMIDGKLTKPKVATKHACEVFADEAIRFIQEPKDAPFLCYIPFDAPHDPHIVPTNFPVNYDPADIPLPPNFLPQHSWDNGEMTIRDEKLMPWPRKESDVRAYLAEYYRYVSFLDVQVGRVLDALEASGQASNTIVVFTADSGVACGSHGLIGKQNCYEHSMRVPLIVKGPGIPAGQQTDAMCYLFDLMPTLGKLCGVAGPSTSDGVSFDATLRNPATPARGEIFLAYKEVQRSVRDGQWKLIRYPVVDKTQLFDLKADPYETANLADKPEQAKRVAAMMGLLARQQTEFGDKAPLKVASPKPAAWSPPSSPE